MEFDKMTLLLDEERISGVRASWTNREVKNTVKSMLKMDRYSNLTKGRFLDSFMKKFEGFINAKNLSKTNIRQLASLEYDTQTRLINK